MMTGAEEESGLVDHKRASVEDAYDGLDQCNKQSQRRKRTTASGPMCKSLTSASASSVAYDEDYDFETFNEKQNERTRMMTADETESGLVDHKRASVEDAYDGLDQCNS